MDNKTDLVGMVFSKLSVVASHELGSNMMKSKWLCVCECGKEKIVTAHNLKFGAVTNCGCMRGKNHVTHGLTKSKEYPVWQQIKERCYNENATSYPNYGGRGILMWKGWFSFQQFYADMGPRPSDKHTVERIDNDGHYEPSNCRWATYAEQARNKSNNVVYEVGGVCMTLTDIATAMGIKRTTLDYRIRRGATIDEAMNKPLQSKRKTPATIA